MVSIKPWHPYLYYYEKLIGIECKQRAGLHQLMRALWKPALRTCPHEIQCETAIVPEEALPDLPLKNIPHKLVELRDAGSVSRKISDELHRRLYGKGSEPTYYECGRGNSRTVLQSFVPLKTLKEIEVMLKRKSSKKKMHKS